MQDLNVVPVFFEALQYPEFARPNFYLLKQQESGWARGVYLTALSEVYHYSMTVLKLSYHAQKRDSKNLNIDELKLPLSKFYKSENETLIDKKTLDDLHLAVHATQYFNTEPKRYSPYEILSFVEYALWFIHNEFQLLVGQKETSDFRPNNQVFSSYLIAQDGPFFDFPTFKSTVLGLLANSQNPQFIKDFLQKFSKTAVDIISLWNNEIFELENKIKNEDESPVQREMIRVEFKAKDLIHSWWSSPELFEIKPHFFLLSTTLLFMQPRLRTLSKEISCVALWIN